MDDPRDREGPGRGEAATPETDHDRVGRSSNLMNSLLLILIGASLGVFWREVFQLTIRAIEMLAR